jgi:hypothetical protein
VLDAVESVRNQSFQDLEIIISDNSNSENAKKNRDVLESALKDGRVRYVRPESELSMADHWQWAQKHARGSYIGYVTDRKSLRLYGLELLHGVLAKDRPGLVCFGSQKVDEWNGHVSLKRDETETRIKTISTQQAIIDFSRGIIPKHSPRMLNSFIRRDVLAKVDQVPGGAFCGISPDYAFLFRVLDEVDDYIHVSARLVVGQGGALSNGRAFKTGRFNAESRDFIAQLSDAQRELLSFGPMKNDLQFVPNAILREYEIVAAKSNSKKFPPIKLAEFYANAARRAAHGHRNPAALANLEKFRVEHGLDVHLMNAANRSNWCRAIARWGSEFAGASRKASIIQSLIKPVQSALWRSGFSNTAVGPFLRSVLQRDAERYYAALFRQGKSRDSTYAERESLWEFNPQFMKLKKS